VLFIADVDNVTYQFGLDERERQRVDAFGHVELREEEISLLSRTKRLCIPITIIVTGWLVTNGASFAAMLSGALMALTFKLSVLATTYKQMSWKEVACSAATSLMIQVASLLIFMVFFSYAG
jgi:hypothetical protein